jgi:anthranilate synthase component 1
LDKARDVSRGFTHIPIATELFADMCTPVEALLAARAAGRECCLLESAPGGESWGRYTFLCFDPEAEIRGDADGVTVSDKSGQRTLPGDTREALRSVLADFRSPRLGWLPPFTGGFVGYFAYEYIGRVERSLRLSARDDVGYHDFRLMLFKKVIAFDSFRQKIYLIVNIRADSLETEYAEGAARLAEIEHMLLHRADFVSKIAPDNYFACGASFIGVGGFEASLSKDAFCEAVERVKKHIFEGDIFQCVPSVRLRAPYGDDLLDAYRVLRTTNPSPYMFYIRFGDMQLCGASPETLVSLHGDEVATYPLAGTCRRSADDAETDALIEAMLQDEKELAEHDMLVDLGRNDIGKICRFGSVRVPEYRGVKKLSHVCHIASKVTGTLRPELGALDVIEAALPAGTLSGAPKKRACEIIDSLETHRRGVYGGAVGYIDFTGDMDLCIGIRMAALKDGYVYVQAGAGIVADSVPEKEYDECLRKAGAMLEAIGGAAV